MARVVINITEFYTYMKAFRDYLRTLAEIIPQSDVFESNTRDLQTALRFYLPLTGWLFFGCL